MCKLLFSPASIGRPTCANASVDKGAQAGNPLSASWGTQRRGSKLSKGEYSAAWPASSPECGRHGGGPPAGSLAAAVEDQGHRSRVDERDLHPGLKLPVARRRNEPAHDSDELRVEALGLDGWGRVDVRRAASLAAVAVKRELRDHEQLAAGVEQ